MSRDRNEMHRPSSRSFVSTDQRKLRNLSICDVIGYGYRDGQNGWRSRPARHVPEIFACRGVMSIISGMLRATARCIGRSREGNEDRRARRPDGDKLGERGGKDASVVATGAGVGGKSKCGTGVPHGQARQAKRNLCTGVVRGSRPGSGARADHGGKPGWVAGELRVTPKAAHA